MKFSYDHTAEHLFLLKSRLLLHSHEFAKFKKKEIGKVQQSQSIRHKSADNNDFLIGFTLAFHVQYLVFITPLQAHTHKGHKKKVTPT